MTPNDHLAERYGDPVRGEHPGPLEDWTELEQAHHRAELLAAMAPKPRPRSHENTVLPAGNPRPRVRGRQERTQSYSPPAGERVAKGTTLAELLAEDWGT